MTGGPDPRRVAPSEPTVAVSVLRALLARAAAAGLAPEALLGRFGLAPTLLEDIDGRVPAAAVRALWEDLPAACNDPELGLNLAAGAPDAALGLVAYLVLHAPTLGQGFVAAVRYASLLQDVAACSVEPVGGRTSAPAARRGLIFAQTPPPGGPAPPRHAVEFAFARSLHMARRSTGVEVRPACVRFAFPRPADTRAHQALFQSPLVFGHARNELELDAASLRLPQRAADPWLRDLVEKHGRALLDRLGERTRLAGQVTAALRVGIQRGEVDLASVARALAVGERTLQRRLAEEGIRFRALADEARRALACQYLGDGSVGLSEIALMLGFSEQAAFQRAFLRWTGLTPGQYRRGAPARLA
jgi:AraC-like DNA-binding protein